MAVTEGQDGYAGQEGITSSSSDYNQLRFIVDQAIGEIWTVKVVRVKAVNAGSATVDVQPLVKQMDGARETLEHGTIYGIPFAKYQGGKNAVVILPVAGDIGVMACADRDISSVKEAKGEANPGSFRRHNPSDGIYLMSLFGDEPDQFVKFTDDGVEIEDKNGNKIVTGTANVSINGVTVDQQGNVIVPGTLQWNGGELTANGATVPGNFVAKGNVVAGDGTASKVGLLTHTHTSAGAGFQTSPPTAGT